MKRATTEQIKSAVSQYMKRRHYQESEISGRKTMITDLGDMSVKKQAHVSTGVENSVSCSSIYGDFNSCDQQFARLRKFVRECSSRMNEDLSALLFPVFVHMYSDILSAGHKASAHKFHERHTEVFHVEDQKDFIHNLRKLDSKAELQAAKDVTEFREHRYTVQLSHASITHLLVHLKEADNMMVLQIINQHINLQGIDSAGRSLELQPSTFTPYHTNPKDCMKDKKNEEKDAKKDIKKELNLEVHKESDKDANHSDVDESEVTPAEWEELRKLKEINCRLAALPPHLPSILFCTIINPTAHKGLCTAAISPDSEKMCCGFENSGIRLFPLQPEPMPFMPTFCSNSSIPMAADYFYKEESERQVRLETESEEGMALLGHSGPVYKVQFTPDSQFLLSSSGDTTVRMWDVAKRTNTAIYRGHSLSVFNLDYCPVTNHFATVSNDRTVKLWALDHLHPLRSFIGHEQGILAVAIHPNGNYVASAGADKTVRLWDIQDGKCLRTMCAHRGIILDLAFSPNGNMLASAGDDRRIYVWDLNSGTVLKELRGHTDTVHALAFSPCNQILASGGLDCVLRLWNVRCGEQDGAASSQIEGHTSSELLNAYSTKSAMVTYLNFPRWHLLYAVGANQ